jgi:hypothetical protein
MLETPHVAVGAAIATKIPNPFLSIPLAFLSHFALEMVPHWNPHLVTEMKKYGGPTKKSVHIIIVDVSLALIYGGFVAYRALPDKTHAITILLACFASVLPDLIEFPYFFLKIKNRFLMTWLKWQKALQVDTTPFWGFITQTATILAAFFWIKN